MNEYTYKLTQPSECTSPMRTQASQSLTRSVLSDAQSLNMLRLGRQRDNVQLKTTATFQPNT